MSDPSSAALTEAYTLIAHQQVQLSELRERHNNTVVELEALQVRYQTVCSEKEALTRPITEDEFDTDSINFPASPSSQVQFLKNQIVELQNAKFNVQLQNSALQSEIQSLKVSSFKRSTSIDTLSRLSDERVSELQQQVQALQTEISNLQANNTVVLGEKASMQYQVQALRAELSRVAALSTPALPTTVDSTLQQQLEAEKMAHLSYITEVAASRRAAQTAHDAEVQAFNSRIDVLQVSISNFCFDHLESLA
jgi:regulator of replication initiation timing